MLTLKMTNNIGRGTPGGKAGGEGSRGGMISYQDRYPITFRFGVTKIFILIIIEGAGCCWACGDWLAS